VKNLDDDFDFVRFLAQMIHRGANDLAEHGQTLLLRDFEEQTAGPFCSSQPAGCLCANYYLSGKSGMKRGTRFAKLAR
jgi:hypothetical protein